MMVVTIIRKRSFLNPTPMMRVLDLSKFLDHEAIAKSLTSPMSVLDPPKAVNHETAVDVKKALSFSVVL
jgi:hypothetical protein